MEYKHVLMQVHQEKFLKLVGLFVILIIGGKMNVEQLKKKKLTVSIFFIMTFLQHLVVLLGT